MGSVSCGVGTDGAEIDLESMPTTFIWNADGTLNYIDVTTNGNVYRQTFTWVDGKVSTISVWRKL